MLEVFINDESFRYDVYSLIKAFYPEEELNINITNEKSADRSLKMEWNGALLVVVPDGIKDIVERTSTKNLIKRKLYDLLKSRSGRELPWGTLTGIRPIKLPARELAKGKNEREIARFMKETYYTSDDKIKLSINIAKKQAKILDNVNNDTASIYIGIPICPSICAYCSFSAYPISAYRNKLDDYLGALKKEILSISKHINKKIISIYIGGGTPTVLSEYQLEDLITTIKSNIDCSHLLEFSVECGRPDSITREKLEVLKRNGAERICINPQTLNEKTLKLIGRSHNVEDIKRAFDMAREVGISSINSDLIIGLPGEGINEVKYTLNNIKELSPENLTVHALSIKRSSRMNLEWNIKSVNLEDGEKIAELVSEYTEQMDMEPYYLYRQKQIAGNLENIGYAKNGFECLYNILIMGEYQDIISAGAGAVSKFITDNKPARVENVKDIDTYINRVDEMIERKLPWL